ncbi:MAG: F0F1 ATP synthase subunit A [Saprospiraceae bacterium]|nr:F0F1 ATP synthase subunit A [Saprospiraceae bacterium]
MKNSNKYRIKFLLTFILTLCFTVGSVFANDEEHINHETTKKEFNAGDMIFDHILDAHEWHIATIGKTHISIPLPIILLDEGKLHVFLSSKFHHGHESYKGYQLMLEGENKGKIIREVIDAKGNKSVVKPLDFSMTKTVMEIIISSILLIIIFVSIAKSYVKRKGHAPKGLQSMIEPLIIFVRDDIAKPSIGEKKFEKYMPFLLSVFFFIFFNNLFGLIPIFPGGANVTGNISVTLVLALFTFTITTFSGNRNYWKHIVNAPGVPWWLKIPFPLMPIVELVGVITKPFVLMVRLFANMTAGHIIILGFMSLIFLFGSMNPALGYGTTLISVPFSIFISLLELLVAFIQAYVFTLLSAMYFGMATEEHH